MPARVRLSWGMKTLKQFLLPVLEPFEFAWQVTCYALIFVSGLTDLVDRDDFKLWSLERNLQKRAADPTETVNCDARRYHATPLGSCVLPVRLPPSQRGYGQDC